MQTRELPLTLAPWALFRVLARKERPFFIDAARPWGGEWISSMGFRPRMQLRVCADEPPVRSALGTLDEALAAYAPVPRDRARPRPVPFGGGAIVALAYETKNEIERLPQRQHEDARAPRLDAAFYDAVVTYDHRRARWRAASWHLDATALGRYAEEVLDAVADAGHEAGREHTQPASTITSNLDRDAYRRRVERIRRYIGAGDVYQANLSMRLETPFVAAHALAAYGRLRAAQPVPFGVYLERDDVRVLSNSPELFLRRRGGTIETAPIKGTRPRGRHPEEDARLATELCRDPKERAEHVMIVDLERNDLGRICRPGSIRVARLADVVSYETVHHLESRICGVLAADVSAGELLRATFPGGSITGAPKIRAMEIIDEVEHGTRGFYTGALGWIDASGDLDLNVAIRTAVAADARLSYSVGSGIVADSEPSREHEECLLKAQAFVRALRHEPKAPDATDVADDVPAAHTRAGGALLER